MTDELSPRLAVQNRHWRRALSLPLMLVLLLNSLLGLAISEVTPAMADQDASGWQIEAVDSEGDVGKYTSLALDTSGSPHIGYYDDTNENLKYA